MNRPWYLDDLLASYECVSDNDVRICDFGDDSRQLKLRSESWKSPRANSDSGAESRLSEVLNQRSPSHSILKLRTSTPGIYCKMPRNGRVTTFLFLPIYMTDGRRWIICLEALDIGRLNHRTKRGPEHTTSQYSWVRFERNYTSFIRDVFMMAERCMSFQP